MAARLFDRRCKVILALPYAGAVGAAIGAIGGAVDRHTMAAQRIEVDGLRTQFRVKRSLSASGPATAEIQITNLSERSRRDFAVKGGKIALLAGHRDTVAQVFIGDVDNVVSTHDGANWQTKIEASDGGRAHRHGEINYSWQGKVSAKNVAQACVAALGLDPGNLAKIDAGRVFDHGYAAVGNAARELTRVLGAMNLGWSIQEGRVQILPRGGATTETIALLSPRSGIIGSPEFSASTKRGGKPVLKIKALLQPGILPGRRVRVEDVQGVRDGLYRCVALEHAGDTNGNADWCTSMDMETYP